MNAFKVYDPTNLRQKPERSRPWAFVACLALTLMMAYLVSGISSLYVHYSYTSSIDSAALTPLEPWGTWAMPSYLTLQPSLQFAKDRPPTNSVGNPAAQTLTGAAIAAALSFLSLRYMVWPIHPFGYLLCFNWGIQQTWFSLMLGWLSKTLVLRVGGARLYRQSRSAFLGLIFGEIWAIGFWMIVALLYSHAGYEYHAIHILP
jgi:hypothetical protein